MGKKGLKLSHVLKGIKIIMHSVWDVYLECQNFPLYNPLECHPQKGDILVKRCLQVKKYSPKVCEGSAS